MFKRSEQYIDEQIADRTYQMARYWVDLYPVRGFPDGAGLRLDKIRFFGDIGPQYDSFTGWRKVQISRPSAEGALCGDNDGCGYVWEDVGHGIETVSFDLMQRDLRTKPICIKDIRTFFQYQETQNLIFQNLANISANMREQLNRNAAQAFAIKYIALPGLPTAQSDPHAFPTIPSGVEVGRLTYRMLLNFYSILAQEAGAYALGSVNGFPAFGIVGHPETLYDMYYENPEIRKDMRWCQKTSCELIDRYNFLETFGPFILMPDMYAPRYNRDANGVLHRVFPFDRNLPIEIGTRPITNPAYHTAEYELVLFLTKDLFNLRTRRPLSSVGGATDFDAEVGMFEWKWHNPDRECDPYRRVGRYVTTAEIGVEPGEFTDIPAVLVKRRPNYLGIEYWDTCTNPPEPVECTNVLPSQPCPCPTVMGVCGAVEDDELVFTFDRDSALNEDDTVEIDTVNGSYVSGTVEEVSSDGTKVRVSFSEVPCKEAGHYTTLRCLDTSYCTAKVLESKLCNILSNQVVLVLDRLLRAAGADVVTLFLNNGDTLDVTIASVDTGNLQYTVGMTYAQFCDGGGVCSVCVPAATDATCPGCDGSGLVDCEESTA